MRHTPRERVLAQIHQRETDYVPYTIRFEGDVAERLDVNYGSDVWRNSIDNAIRRLRGPDPEVRRISDPCDTDLYGSTWRVDRRTFHLVEPALKTPSLKGFAFPGMDATYLWSIDDAYSRQDKQ